MRGVWGVEAVGGAPPCATANAKPFKRDWGTIICRFSRGPWSLIKVSQPYEYDCNLQPTFQLIFHHLCFVNKQIISPFFHLFLVVTNFILFFKKEKPPQFEIFKKGKKCTNWSKVGKKSKWINNQNYQEITRVYN